MCMMKTESTCSVCGPHCGVQLSVPGFADGAYRGQMDLTGARLIYPFIIDADQRSGYS